MDTIYTSTPTSTAKDVAAAEKVAAAMAAFEDVAQRFAEVQGEYPYSPEWYSRRDALHRAKVHMRAAAEAAAQAVDWRRPLGASSPSVIACAAAEAAEARYKW